MVKLIPPYIGEEVNNNAEKKIFEVLQGLDMEDAYVLHSFGLHKHQSKIYGDIDFVIVCKRGVACFVIKDGSVECKDGLWKDGNENQVNPFAQVTESMLILEKVLKNKFINNEALNSVFVASGVIFSDIEFTVTSEEVIKEIVYDVKTDSITDYINGIFEYWENILDLESSNLSKKDIQDIVYFLRRDFVFIPTVSDRPDKTEERFVRFTGEQAEIMNALSINNRLLIEGKAGTGKTLLAIEFARKRAIQGDKVLYLTFNKNLAYNINTQLDQNDNLKVMYIYAFFGECVGIDIDEIEPSQLEYMEVELPEMFYFWLNDLSFEELEELQYDFLVIDDGHDIIKPSYLYSLDMILKNGFAGGDWAIFYDEKQNVFNPEYADGIDIVESYPCTKFNLLVNCRNTAQIGDYTSKVSGLEMKEFLCEHGEEVCQVSYSDIEDFRYKIDDIMKTLQTDNVDLADVVFLSPKKYIDSLLAVIGFEVNELGANFDNDSSLPRFATIKDYKGLDSKIVVLVDVEEISEENFDKCIYIAGTRARTLLYVVGSDDFGQGIVNE